MLGFEAAMPQFEALGAQVVGVSADPAPALAAWKKDNNAGGKQILLSDFPRRQMLQTYGALEMNEQSPVYRYAKRAYFIIDKTGTVKYVKIMDSPLDLLSADEVLKALKDSRAT
jgi:thioredoxin-dependent peroxiredoxin